MRFHKEEIGDMRFIVDESTMTNRGNGIRSGKAYSTTDLTIDDLVDLLNNFDDTVETLQRQLLATADLDKPVNQHIVKENNAIADLKNLCRNYNITLEQVYTICEDSIENHDKHYDKVEYTNRILGLIDKQISRHYVKGEYTEMNQLQELKEEVMLL